MSVSSRKYKESQESKNKILTQMLYSVRQRDVSVSELLKSEVILYYQGKRHKLNPFGLTIVLED